MQEEVLGLQELPEPVGAGNGMNEPMLTNRHSALSILGDCTTGSLSTF